MIMKKIQLKKKAKEVFPPKKNDVKKSTVFSALLAASSISSYCFEASYPALKPLSRSSITLSASGSGISSPFTKRTACPIVLMINLMSSSSASSVEESSLWFNDFSFSFSDLSFSSSFSNSSSIVVVSIISVSSSLFSLSGSGTTHSSS